MTEPRDMQREQQTGAEADAGLEVRPEVIQDLDVTDDADVVRGGRCAVLDGTTVRPGVTAVLA